MHALKFLLKNSWMALLVVCLVSFIPLALNADVVGGIPSWVYWALAQVLTLVLVVWAIVASIYHWMHSKDHNHFKGAH